MSLTRIHRETILTETLKTLLSTGNSVSIDDVDISSISIENPIFTSNSFSVSKNELSSAAKFNSSMQSISTSLNLLYKYLSYKTESLDSLSRTWKTIGDGFSLRIKGLENRITSLLLLQSDTYGYFNYIEDNFSSTEKVDSTSTTLLDTSKGILTVGSGSIESEIVDTRTLSLSNISFAVLSRNGLISESDMAGSSLIGCLTGESFWQKKIITSNSGTVFSEIVVTLPNTIPISRIDVDPLCSSEVEVTFLYSTDGYTWTSLKTSSLKSATKINFSSVSVRYIKLILKKESPDSTENGQYIYLIGINKLQFYSEDVSTTSSTFYSTPLSIAGISIGKASLDVCESISDNSDIEYYLSASNSITPGQWVRVDPISRDQKNYSSVVDFSRSTEVTVSGLSISYQTGASEKFINPAQNYTIINSVTNGLISESTCQSSDRRYIFDNSSHCLLDHSIASGVQISPQSIELWRNTKSGLTVRGVASGWGYSAPYYQTMFSVTEEEGRVIDFGLSPVEIDGVKQAGNTTISYGIHLIRIHQDNWIEISSGITSLSSLKSADKLYPFNQRYLIEGYDYPISWTEEKVYRGFSVFGEFRMNADEPKTLAHFLLDTDLADSGAIVAGLSSSRPSQTVILLRVDSSKSDFINEKFTLKFKVPEDRFQYVFLKAVLTANNGVAPTIDSYRIKIAS